MSLLLPLGLLGLISLAVLLLIYILKPNYQQKLISSTYIWKLSLKYKRKRVPISKLRNLLIILCQIIILTMAAIILSDPANVTKYPTDYNEKIVVIDASASMLAESDGETRFARAKTQAAEIAQAAFDKNSAVTVIIAGREATYVAQRAVKQDESGVLEQIKALECTYGKADMTGAFALAEETLEFNSDSEVILLTGTDYVAANKRVKVNNVGKEGEWNAAILDVTAELENGFYTITVEVASYGADKALDVLCEISGANGTTGVTTLPIADLYCSDDETFKVVYTTDPDRVWGDNATPVVLSDDRRIYSYDQIYIHIDEPDNYIYDNEYYLFGGNKPTVKMAYCSDNPNNFLGTVLLQTVGTMRDRWNIEVKEFDNSFPDFDSEEGKFDLYIFEHVMPNKLPTDGIVFMVDPDKAAGAGFTITRNDVHIPNWSGDGAALAAGKEHPIMNFIDASAFRVTSYTQIDENSLDDGYEVLMYYEGNPVFFIKDEPDTKIAVMSIDFKMSNMSISMYFPMMLYNFFDYWLPAAFDDDVYNIYDSVKLNARGEELTVIDPDDNEKVFDTFPSELTVDGFGTYMVSQQLMNGVTLTEQFYARIDSSQSNIYRKDDVMLDPTVEDKPDRTYEFLVIYFAAVMVAVLLLEWWLQSRSGI